VPSGLCGEKLCGVPEHREEVAGRSRDHEQVPDEMVVSDPLSGEECEAAGVGDSAREYQKNSGKGNQHHYWLDRYHREPTHNHVQHDRDS